MRNRDNHNNQKRSADEKQQPAFRHFSSQREAEEFNMIQHIELSDMEKFKLFCRMMRIGNMLANAKIVDK